MDLPLESLLKCFNNGLCYLLHAFEEGTGRLEKVTPRSSLQKILTRSSKLTAIDFFGTLLALTGSALLVLALTWAGGEYAWLSVHVLATLCVGFIVSVSFVLWQWKGTKVPLVPSKLLPIVEIPS
jgi:hypothetical protein